MFKQAEQNTFLTWILNWVNYPKVDNVFSFNRQKIASMSLFLVTITRIIYISDNGIVIGHRNSWKVE